MKVEEHAGSQKLMFLQAQLVSLVVFKGCGRATRTPRRRRRRAARQRHEQPAASPITRENSGATDDGRLSESEEVSTKEARWLSLC